jgi:hypothetical protein
MPNDVMTLVYRLYAADGALLYVGITEELDKRFLRHSARLWWPEVASVLLEAYETRRDALRVESWAIYTEGPVHNRLRPDADEDELPQPLSSVISGIEAFTPRPRPRLRGRR